MIAQNAAEIKTLHTLYEDISARLLSNSPFESPSAAWQGYERVVLITGINISLDYISGTAALWLLSNSRTDSLARLRIATRRARSDYESHLTPTNFSRFTQVTFSLDEDTANLLAAYIAAKTAHGAILNGRLDRALDIATAGHVKRNGSGFQIDSQTGTGTHTVTHTATNGWSCTCQDRAPQIETTHKGCKHVAATWMSIKAKLDIPQVEPAPARINGNGRGRLTTCETCKRDWQECDCPTSGQLPEPVRITTPENAGHPLTIAEQKQAARNSLNIKQEAGRQTSASLAIRHW